MTQYDKVIDRTKFIGGSDIATVMGLSPWSTPLQLWAEKTGKIPPKDLSDIEAVEIGTELESYVANKFSRKTGYKVKIDNRTFIHKKYPYIAGHIDRWIVGEDALLECKTTSAYMAKHWEGESIPQNYILQVMLYLGLVGKKIGYIACLIGGQKFAWKQVEFDQKLYDKMIDSAVDFWENYVLKNIPPVAMADDGDILSALFPDASDQIVRFDDAEAEEINSLVEQRDGGLEQMKLVKEETDRLSNVIKQKLGKASFGETNQYKISWKPQRVQPFINVDAMKADGVYEKYEANNQSRVLRISKLKGAKP